MSSPSTNHVTNHRLLVVDDNTSIHEDFRRILSPSDAGHSRLERDEAIIFGDSAAKSPKADYQLAFATQGEQAVSLVESAMDQGMPFAAAMVDVRMPPGIDGIQTIKKLWAKQRDLEIVICTAYSEYSWEEIIEELGPTHRAVILKKPFDPIEVLQLAQALTTKWGAGRDAAFRQLDLQGRLLQGSERLVETCERLRVEQELRQRLEKSVQEIQRTDSLARLAMGIAHDFNNLLTVIQGHLSLAMDDPNGLNTTDGKLERVLKAARRATDLSRQLVSLSRETDGRVRPVDVAAHIAREMRVLERSLGESYRIDVSLDPSLPTILAEPLALTHLVANLMLNARDCMPNGGPISVSARLVQIPSTDEAAEIHSEARPGSFVRLTVIDAGRGYSKEEVASLFEPDSDKGRTRVGLSVVRSLAREWGGWVTVRSVPDVGSEFSVFLPKTHAPNKAPVSAPPPGDELVEPSVILVVDDDSAVRELVTFLLKRQGHAVLSAGSADEAWQLWTKDRLRIQLVISDIQLPGTVSGFDLAASIHEEDGTVPFIFMSGCCPDLLTSPQQLTIGVDFVPKPFDVIDLLNAVGARLADSQKESTFSASFTTR